jgi:hypothetical protein
LKSQKQKFFGRIKLKIKREELNMKSLIKNLSRLLLMAVFLFSGFFIVQAKSSIKPNTINFSADKKVSSKKAGLDLNEKLHSQIPKFKKAKFSKEKSLKKGRKKVNNSCSLGLVTEGCFTNCLARYVSPELVAHCADACGRGDAATCAGCLGIAVGTVVYCAIECSGYIPEVEDH